MNEAKETETTFQGADPQLLELALSVSNLSERTLWEELTHPVWEGWHAKWGWGVIVPCCLRDRWNELSIDVRLAVYITAELAWDGGSDD
jgi:hypothetical protein